MSINIIVVIISQYICVLNHYIIYFELKKFLCQLYLNKLDKKWEKERSILSELIEITLGDEIASRWKKPGSLNECM